MINNALARSFIRTGMCFRSVSLRRVHDTAKRNDIADVVICGGGLIGLCQAIALGSNAHFKNRRIVLLESQDEKKTSPHVTNSSSGYSNRVVALSPSSIDLLTKIGVWQRILDTKRVGIVRQMRVFDGCSDAAINFDSSNVEEDSNSNALCYIAEVPALIDALTTRLQTVPNVNVLYGSKVTGLAFDWLLGDEHNAQHQVNEAPKFMSESYGEVQLAGRPSIRCRLLIGADGHNSTIRRLANIHTVVRSQGQAAIVATLRCKSDGSVSQADQVENDTAFQRFLPAGPIAVLPLRNNFCSLVWSTTKQHAATLMQLSDEEFLAAVNNAFNTDRHVSKFAQQTLRKAANLVDTIRERFDPVGKAQADVTVNFDSFASAKRQYPPKFDAIDAKSRAAYDLAFAHATHYTKSRFALVGDAAHRVLPLAGLGMNLGYGDVAALTRVLCEAVRCGADIGDFDYLRRYETERQRFNVPVSASIEALNTIYSTSFDPLVALRSLGLSTVNACPPLKRAIIRSAMFGVLTL